MDVARARRELDRFLGITDTDDESEDDGLTAQQRAGQTLRERNRHTWTGPVCPPRPDWFDDAACRGHETRLFFAFGQQGRREVASPERAAAFALCEVCPVRAECRDYARAHEMQGIWGGETDLDRARDGYGAETITGNARKELIAHRRATQ